MLLLSVSGVSLVPEIKGRFPKAFLAVKGGIGVGLVARCIINTLTFLDNSSFRFSSSKIRDVFSALSALSRSNSSSVRLALVSSFCMKRFFSTRICLCLVGDYW